MAKLKPEGLDAESGGPIGVLIRRDWNYAEERDYEMNVKRKLSENVVADLVHADDDEDLIVGWYLRRRGDGDD